MSNVFSEAGISEQDVRAWAKGKASLKGLSDEALAQLYSIVVLKKKIKKPYPVMTVGKLWEEINAINNGTKQVNSRKLFVGLKDVVVVGLSNSITYVGCPKCLKGKKKIGASKCAGHGTELVDLEELSWNEWLVFDDDDNFIIKMSPQYMNDYNEINMTGGKIYVDGVVDLDSDPIMLMVNNVRGFEAGTLMPGAEEQSVLGDDFTIGRDEVDLAGFDEDDEEVSTIDDEDIVEKKVKNPFIIEDEKESIISDNGVSDEFKEALKEKFTTAMNEFAVNPVKRIQVERYMLDWIEQDFPMEFGNSDEAIKKFWELVDGMYKKVDAERLQKLD